MAVVMPGLGRKVAPDDRDQSYPLRALLGALEVGTPKPYAYYYGLMQLDQGSTSMCVEYSWHHYLQTGLVRPKQRWPYWNVGEPYHMMQQVDEWPGDAYDGTSVRAGAKVMQQLGFIDSYLWAWDLTTVVDSVLTAGPVVMGTNWYEGMFEADARKPINVSGRLAGGHAWLLEGVSATKGIARAKNSWGTDWGFNGRFYITFEDLERLILEEGEACMAVESK